MSEPLRTQSLQHACRSFAFPEPGLALASSSSSACPMENFEMHAGSSGSLPTGRVPSVPKQSRRGPDAEKVPLPSFVKLELHKQGRCEPCLYNSKPGGGCWYGKECRFCHLCTAEQIRKRQSRQYYLERLQRREREQQTGGVPGLTLLHCQSSKNKTYVTIAWVSLLLFCFALLLDL